MNSPSWGLHYCIVYDPTDRKQIRHVLRKRWDYTNKCWIVVERGRTYLGKQVIKQNIIDADVRKEGKYYDSTTNTWIDLDGKGTPNPPGEEGTTGFSSCELPPREQKLLGPAEPYKDDDADEHYKTCVCVQCRPHEIKNHPESCACWKCWDWKKGKGLVGGYHSHQTPQYKPVKPWEGIDRAKWPNTYFFCVSLYYIGNRWYEGKSIPDEDYRNRVTKGIYKPEPKYPKYYGTEDYHNFYGNHD